ncbi:phospholipase D-like domain-containing protein [Rhodalgimonas zhirmunskyi]|uniref:Phospholipase D n=1 Tax=Rhodalgimonas zhirmunskyi TaxID=2964767 RepID=A0AAJ1U8A5_9RHOB|nr:phospholipase D family protein [Rhodoalgimonas zhirmunskyi]MDQ2095455.1 phospholipase D family protein [Rhodoalgimonas zhirmunskyi]
MSITSASFLAVLVALLVLALAVYALRRLFALPDISNRAQAPARPLAKDTDLGRAVSRDMIRNPGKTGVVPLLDAKAAFAYRLAMVDKAQVSIDVQYYIWRDDVSGLLLIDALRRAAKRGVKVRLLLDDIGISGVDPYIAALTNAPNFDVRLFNPSTARNPKLLSFAFDFMRMNRRMHNKSLIVDGAAAIIGGRNIGDEYSQTNSDLFFLDLDVLVTGVIVSDISQMFAAYWNCLSAYEADLIIPGPGDPDRLNRKIADLADQPAAQEFRETAAQIVSDLATQEEGLEWTDVQLLADDPAKGRGGARRDQLMVSRLVPILAGVETRLDLMSAYFVPGKPGRKAFSKLAKSGKTVNVLTNAIDTTDVLLVHSGYTKYRRALLKSGVTLFELKRQDDDTEGKDHFLPLGLSGTSLHAKTFAIDDARIFIGSFNFDMRSAMLNCEMGVLIESPTLARRMREAFDTRIALSAYRPALSPSGKLVWHEDLPNGGRRVHKGEPGATLWQRMVLAIIGRLPVEWLL